jgi:hypothetical protein
MKGHKIKTEKLETAHAVPKLTEHAVLEMQPIQFLYVYDSVANAPI